MKRGVRLEPYNVQSKNKNGKKPLWIIKTVHSVFLQKCFFGGQVGHENTYSFDAKDVEIFRDGVWFSRDDDPIRYFIPHNEIVFIMKFPEEEVNQQ